jgi:CO/xanthine dehydrogenase Mo-binding subunit
LRQIVAETLSMPIEQVRSPGGQHRCLRGRLGAGGSRVTHVAGQATYQAAEELKTRICEVVAQLFGCQPGDVTLSQDAVPWLANGSAAVVC